MKTIKLSSKDFIRLSFEDEDILVSMRFNKRSTLKKRFEILDRFKKILQFGVEDENN